MNKTDLNANLLDKLNKGISIITTECLLDTIKTKNTEEKPVEPEKQDAEYWKEKFEKQQKENQKLEILIRYYDRIIKNREIDIKKIKNTEKASSVK
ncbi:hypothetical protein [[Mycoplasma] testudinis]|uniref:hypothetical protein n=1 Tax=[Mycoplasma] testudinis TaxID=33924 RepID=UPI0004806A6E|nr:hypothetical protein [[Mycoplasma] testudinis]